MTAHTKAIPIFVTRKFGQCSIDRFNDRLLTAGNPKAYAFYNLIQFDRNSVKLFVSLQHNVHCIDTEIDRNFN